MYNESGYYEEMTNTYLKSLNNIVAEIIKELK